MQILSVHLGVGILAALGGALCAGWRTGRRLTLYVLTLQIGLGVVLIVQGLRAPSLHYTAAVIAWGGLMAANAVERRGRRPLALGLAVVSALLLIAAFALGWNAAPHPLGAATT